MTLETHGAWRAITLALLATVVAVPAFADDMTVSMKKTKPKAAPMQEMAAETPPPLAYSWAGYYVGGFVGGAHGVWTNDFYRNNNHGHSAQGMDGFSGGGWLGYNMYVAPNIIVGVEADLGRTNASEDNEVYDNDTTYATYNSFGSLRGRLGYTMDNVMLYGTAGLAFANVTEDLQKGRNAGEQLVQDNKGLTGYAIGAGAEYAFSHHWLGRVEYLYSNFGTFSFYNADNQLAEFNNQLHQLRVGMSYKF